jgi:hypothetical protein
VFAKSIASLERDGTQTEDFGLRWQSAAATALSNANTPDLVLFQSRVTLRLPPQSKISHFVATSQETTRIFSSLWRFLIQPYYWLWIKTASLSG